MSAPLARPRPRILYFADTMCSWCYGFAPEMSAVLAALGTRAELVLFTGGLRPFNTEPVDEKLLGYLRETYPRISAFSGQPFTTPRSLMPGFIYDTEPAARAVVCVRELLPGHEHTYMLALQRAFYDAGEDITRADILADHAVAAGLERGVFMAAFESEPIRQLTLGDFQVAQRFGISGFPSLIVHRQDAEGRDELVLVSQGYAKADHVLAQIEDVLGKQA